MKRISLEELKARLAGNGLMTESLGVFFADHIVVSDSGGDLLVQIVSDSEADGRKTASRLAVQLEGIENVRVLLCRNPLRKAS